MMKTQAIIGRGPIFAEDKSYSHTMLLILDSIQPEGVTEVLVDRSSILPHLGMLIDRNREAALQILSDECLNKIGTCVAPKGRARPGEAVMSLRVSTADGVVAEETVNSGELKSLPLGAGESARIEVTPAKRFDVGMGRGKMLEAEVTGGVNGLVLDARGRPLVVPDRREVIASWMKSLAPLPKPTPMA
jgi:hypothetical protein